MSSAVNLILSLVFTSNKIEDSNEFVSKNMSLCYKEKSVLYRMVVEN